MFRYRSSVPLSYERQGLVYFYSRLYRDLTEDQKRAIRAACRKAGGESWRALLQYVTGEASAGDVCSRHFVSRATLDRMVARYYAEMNALF